MVSLIPIPEQNLPNTFPYLDSLSSGSGGFRQQAIHGHENDDRNSRVLVQVLMNVKGE